MTYLNKTSDFTPAPCPRTTAREFMLIWREHGLQWQQNALVYIDYLIDEIQDENSDCSPAEIAQQLYDMMPELKLGTAHRLLALKFPPLKNMPSRA